MANYGLDVSKHQGALNFKAIAKDNSFVILRIGYGVSGTSDQKDSRFEEYYKAAKAAGLKIGGYYYSYAKSVAQAKTEAKNCLKYLGGKQLNYPIYYDCEDPKTVGKQSTATIAKMCDAFCEVIKSAGYTPGLYASTSWFKSKGVKNANSEWVRWEANYGKNDGKTVATSLYNKNVPMHQYTSRYSGKYAANGAAIRVDRNIDYSTLEHMAPTIPETSVIPTPAPEQKPVENDVQYAIFPMKTMRFSAIWNTSTPHKKCSNPSANHRDFPTDLVGADTGRDWAYARGCDWIVLRKYTKASHAIWLRTVDKVQTPYGYGYLYMMSEHQDNAEMRAVGKIYKNGEKMFREGRNGNATGYHLHVSMGFSTSKKTSSNMGTGWIKNNKGAWVLHIPGVTNIKIEQAFYVDKTFTTIKDERIKFKTVPSGVNNSNTVNNSNEYAIDKTYHVTVDTLNIRSGHKKSATKLGIVKKGAKITPISIYKPDEHNVWLQISKDKWVCAVENGRVYIK